MYIEIDFNSEEAYYMQLRNRIIEGIATGRIIEGEALPSVRKMSEDIGINIFYRDFNYFFVICILSIKHIRFLRMKVL